MNGIIIGFLVLLLQLTGPIVLDSNLCQTAQDRADHIATYDDFYHMPPKANCGEILGRTTGNVAHLYDAFMRSPAHLRVMSMEWDSIGIGVADNERWRIIIVVVFCREVTE